ncbi:MAG: hypothetical protein AAF984_10335 [Verrucomicrobiota bacterium]
MIDFLQNHFDLVGNLLGEGVLIAIAAFVVKRFVQTEKGAIAAEMVSKLDAFIESSKSEPEDELTN